MTDLVDVDRYSVVIRKTPEGFEGTVREFPDLVAYEGSAISAYRTARALIAASLEVLGANAPSPLPFEEF